MRISYLILGASLLTAGAGVAVAQPHGGFGNGEEMLFHGLSLSDAQKSQMKTIRETAWAQEKPLMEQMHSLHEQIVSQMLSSPSVTAADVQPLVTQEESLRAQLDTLHLNTALQMRGLLTSAQLSQASTLHQQMEALHEQERALMKPAADAE